MNAWQEQLALCAGDNRRSTGEVFDRIEAAALGLGFECYAYAVQAPAFLRKPFICQVDNFEGRSRRQSSMADLQADLPMVRLIRSGAGIVPLAWADTLHVDGREVWPDTNERGLRFGWAQACVGMGGLRSVLALCRSNRPVIPRELDSRGLALSWLAEVAHRALSLRLLRDHALAGTPALSRRELQVLRWSAQGKTVVDISKILSLSRDTVSFHVKNAVRKLDAPNKTAAAVAATALGLIA